MRSYYEKIAFKHIIRCLGRLQKGDISMKMYRFILIAITVMLALPAVSQVRKVRMCDPNARAREAYIEGYEYDFVDERPQFPGGERGLVNFINQTREYPYDAYMAGVQGRVLCSFIINTDGSVSDISVVRGCNQLLNREAVRVISEMPKWKAGKMGNKTVPVMYLLPIVFRL